MPTKEELERELASAQRKITRLEKAAEDKAAEEKEPEKTPTLNAQARAFKAELKKVPPEDAGRWKLTLRALEEAVPEYRHEVQWG